MRSLELFSGAGGLALGLAKSGITHCRFVEFDKNACQTLRSNFDPNIVFEGDVRKYDPKDDGRIDLVAGGPPCQPFSLGGKHQANLDQRDMFPPAIELVRKLKPKVFLFENVKGLLRNSFQPYFQYVIRRLEQPESPAYNKESWADHSARLASNRSSDGLRYDVQFKLVNAADYGVPQTRERVIIVGVRSDLGLAWEFPSATHSKAALLHDLQPNGVYWERHKIPKKYQPDWLSKPAPTPQTSLFEEQQKPWRTVRDALNHLPEPDVVSEIPDHIFKDGARTYPGHTGSYIDWPAKTLKAGVHGVPGGENMLRRVDGSVRYFTVHEAKLLQTFPCNFHFLGAWSEAMRQIGNAVPVQLAQTIGESLAKSLEVRSENAASSKAA